MQKENAIKTYIDNLNYASSDAEKFQCNYLLGTAFMFIVSLL